MGDIVDYKGIWKTQYKQDSMKEIVFSLGCNFQPNLLLEKKNLDTPFQYSPNFSHPSTEDY